MEDEKTYIEREPCHTCSNVQLEVLPDCNRAFVDRDSWPKLPFKGQRSTAIVILMLRNLIRESRLEAIPLSHSHQHHQVVFDFLDVEVLLVRVRFAITTQPKIGSEVEILLAGIGIAITTQPGIEPLATI